MWVEGAVWSDYTGEAPTRYLFEIRAGKPADRYWVKTQVRRVGLMAGLTGITPRTFRRSFATQFVGDTADLLTHGGWGDSRTLFRTYRRSVPSRHKDAVMRTWGVQDEDEPLGYG